jgi:hypothetical protein
VNGTLAASGVTGEPWRSLTVFAIAVTLYAVPPVCGEVVSVMVLPLTLRR